MNLAELAVAIWFLEMGMALVAAPIFAYAVLGIPLLGSTMMLAVTWPIAGVAILTSREAWHEFRRAA